MDPPPLAARIAPEALACARAIVIERDDEARGSLRAMLLAAGAGVVEASGIDEVLERADRGDAGVVLCGVSDGGDTLRALAADRLSRRPASPWALVAVLPETSLDAARGRALVEQMQALADDFLQMPIDVRWLGARLRLYARMCAYVSRMEAQRAVLKGHQDEAEEEQRIANHLISRFEGRDPLAERLMHAWVSPAHQLSGDMVAIARAPDDRINVLLADGTGHGLSAAISVLPVREVFHRMTDRGFDIASIVTEMNRKLRSCMPVDRFVACAAASIDMRERVIEIWNGGCPPVMLLASDGSLERVYRSRHMALGILDGKDFDSSVERCAYREQSQLMLVSDGLSEALSQDGKHRFGDRELLEAVRGPSDQRRERVVNCLHDFNGGRPLDDDASILLVDCLLEPLVEPAVEPAAPAPATDGVPGSQWAFEIRLGPAQLRHITLVPFVSGLVEQLGMPRQLRSNVFCVLSELLANALDYGVLGIDPSVLEQENGRMRIREARAQRLATLVSGSLWIKAAVEPASGGEYLQVEIEDSGGGFDMELLETRLSRLAGSEGIRRGPGLELVRSLCESLRFDQEGRRVVAVIALTRPG